MSETVNFIQGSKNNYDSSTMQGGVYFSKDSKEILLNGESYGNAVPADEEDITAANGSLKLKDREVDAANFQSRGYKILRKNIVDGKNILTQDMINEPNTIYEIRYDFDLNGATITIPDNCILKFEGGVLSNGNIKGTNTVIEAPLKQIFKFDRTKYYISGTWNLSKWNCSWFGTVRDGNLSRNNNETDFSGTDNYEAIQTCLDTANNTNIKEVILEEGTYYISKGLMIGYNGYHNISFKGSRKSHAELKQGTVLLCGGEYGIMINSGRSARITGLKILGKNFFYLKEKKFFVYGHHKDISGMSNSDNWVCDGVKSFKDSGKSRYCPYAGIVVDGYNFTDGTIDNYTHYDIPKLPAYITSLKVMASSETIIREVTIEGFYVGVGYSVSSYNDNNDFNVIYDSTISNNVLGVSWGNDQARNTSFFNTSISAYTALSTIYFGAQKGNFLGTALNCCFDSCYQIYEVSRAYTGGFKFQSCYAEVLLALSTRDGGWSSGNNISVSFEQCEFNLVTPYQNNTEWVIPSNIDVNPVIMKNCSFRATGRFVSLPGPSITENCKVVSAIDNELCYFNNIIVHNTPVTLNNTMQYSGNPYWNYGTDYVQYSNFNPLYLKNWDNTKGVATIQSSAAKYFYNYTEFDNGSHAYIEGDYLVSDKIAGVITSINDDIITVDVVNGYKLNSDGTYSLSINEGDSIGAGELISAKPFENYKDYAIYNTNYSNTLFYTSSDTALESNKVYNMILLNNKKFINQIVYKAGDSNRLIYVDKNVINHNIGDYVRIGSRKTTEDIITHQPYTKNITK